MTHIPPESWNDINLARTEKVDVYAFGVMLWEMFSERRPWIKGSPCFRRLAIYQYTMDRQ